MVVTCISCWLEESMADMLQCVLRRGYAEMVTWLPAEYAKVGKTVDLRIGKTWDEGWKVEVVHSTRLPTEYIREHSNDYRTQREASDV
jgi:hypothetical protein